MAAHRAAWADLTERALEDNVFLDPAFALPLVQHVSPSSRPDFLLVWEGQVHHRLLALLPVRTPRIAVLGRARGFRDKLVCLGTPLLDRERGLDAFAAMLDWLAKNPSRPAALILTALRADGPFMTSVIANLATAHAVVELGSHHRAVLHGVGRGDAKVLSLQSAKTRKERKRQRRRLDDHGARAYVSARTPAAVVAATEAFLALEGKGWKGRRGTALLTGPGLATFTRTMMQAMAEEGKGRVDALELNGQAVAMGLILTSGSCAYFWKTAFEENLASLSPGVQFTMDLADAQIADLGTSMTDSCAIPDHPMIDKLWPDRTKSVDLAIAVRPGPSRTFTSGIRIERTQRAVRALVKRMHVYLNAVRRD